MTNYLLREKSLEKSQSCFCFLFIPRFINHNPLDCNHVTIHVLKHLRETAGLESFDGHEIECPREPSVINDRPFGKLNPYLFAIYALLL